MSEDLPRMVAMTSRISLETDCLDFLEMPDLLDPQLHALHGFQPPDRVLQPALGLLGDV